MSYGCYSGSAGCYSPFNPYPQCGPCAPQCGPCGPSSCAPTLCPPAVCDSTVANLVVQGTATVASTMTVAGNLTAKNLTLSGKTAGVATVAAGGVLTALSGTITINDLPLLNPQANVTTLAITLPGVTATSVIIATINTYGGTTGVPVVSKVTPTASQFTLQVVNAGSIILDSTSITISYVVL